MAGALLVLGLAAPAAADLYRWVDAQGTVRYTNTLQSIPEAYRASAEEIGAPQGRAGEGASAGPGGPTAGGAEARPAGARARNEAGAVAPGPGPILLAAGGQVRASALVNGVPLTLLVDTGADRTVISPAALVRAGIDVDGGRVVNIVGVTGSTAARQVTVPRLDVAGAAVGPLGVIAHDVGAGDLDGLLGRDVLDFFILTVDSRGGQATLTPR